MSRPALLDRLRETIAREGPLPFSRFVGHALYDEPDGYYASGPARIGRDGDFVTASDVGREFGRCLARQLAEIDERLGRPARFELVEHGAGRGLLARDVLDALADEAPALARRTACTLVDRSAAMRESAAARVPEARVVAPDASPRGGAGCVVANELFDALPFDRVRQREAGLVEIRVGTDDAGRLVEVECPAASRPELGLAPGHETELVPGLGRTLSAVTGSLDRGVVLVCDYGDRGARRHGASRPRGTALAYHEHGTSEDLLARVGEQDLTADVDFGALVDEARSLGWTELGYTTQDRFLIANGLVECFEQDDLAAARDPRRVKRRMQALQLIHPSGMGRRFKLLALGRDVSSEPPLRGFVDPFGREP